MVAPVRASKRASGSLRWGVRKSVGFQKREVPHFTCCVPAVMKMLLNRGLIDGKQMSVTGRTSAENLAEVTPIDKVDQKIVASYDKPIKKDGHIQIMKGTLAPGGCVGAFSVTAGD